MIDCLCDSYTSDELRSLPVNTVLNGRRDESQQDTVNEQTDAAAAATTTTNGGGGNGSVADEDDKNLQVSIAQLSYPVTGSALQI